MSLLELFAVTNRGLESICAAEMAQIRGLHVTSTAYRRVHAAMQSHASALLKLRTVDDIFIHLATWHNISTHRSALPIFEQLARDLDLWQAMDVCAQIRPLPDAPSFSVSANFVGRRNYNADEIKTAIAQGVNAITGWSYEDDDRQSNLNLRIFIEHETVIVGMRLAQTPLYKRTYKQAHLPGSLKPSVAAALVFLAAAPPNARLLDPCCGVGTILIEAAAWGMDATGGDLATAAVAAAQNNAGAAGYALDIQNWDARALPIPSASVDRIVTNLPWGLQVEVDSELAEFYGAACAEMERVLKDDGRLVLLTNRPDLVMFPTRRTEQEIEISLFGQLPTILLIGPSQTAFVTPEDKTSADV